MSSFKDWRSRAWLMLLPALALATPTLAQELADTQEPGSVIIFPKFNTGSFTVHPGTAGQFVAAKTVIEVGTVCPIGVVCAFGDKVNVHFHWVCPPVAGSTICTETDFVVPFTVDPNGGGDKLTFNPSQISGEINGTATNLNGGLIPIAPCPAGYLIGWVVNTNDQPIRFDALIGDAVQRNSATDLQVTSAYEIQAVGPSDKGTITLAADGGLPFDGASYKAVTGQLSGDVRFDSDLVEPFGDSFLIFLTLDVRSEQTNTPTQVQLDFYSQENLLSTAWSFTCWGQIRLSNLEPNLTVASMGHSKGLFVSHQAVDPSGVGRTLLGVVQVTESNAAGGPPGTPFVKSYTVRPSNNSVPVPTEFVPSF